MTMVSEGHGWTHPICDGCWQRRDPGREAARAVGPLFRENCCWCGEFTDGIYVRENPLSQDLWCGTR